MTDEQKILNSFRAIDPRQRANMVIAMDAMAKRFPQDAVVRPLLSLVAPIKISDSLGKRANEG